MPVATNIKYKDYLKAVRLAAALNFDEFKYISKSGSARRFELYKEGEVVEMWVAHESKFIHSKDFKQTLGHLGMTEEEFRELL